MQFKFNNDLHPRFESFWRYGFYSRVIVDLHSSQLRLIPYLHHTSSVLSEIFNEGGIKIISLSNIRPIIIYFHSSQCRLILYLHQRPIFFKPNSIHSSIVAILELIRGAQCLIEVIRSSGEEMWHVDAYQIPYYSRGIEGEKRIHPRFADWVDLTWWPFCTGSVTGRAHSVGCPRTFS